MESVVSLSSYSSLIKNVDSAVVVEHGLIPLHVAAREARLISKALQEDLQLTNKALIFPRKILVVNIAIS